MLVLMASLATLGRGLALRPMFGADAGVALAAGGALGSLVLMGTVTAEAILTPVHLHGRDRSLCRGVAAVAISRRRRFVPGALERENVTARAVGFHARAEALGGGAAGVFDARLLLVTGRAAGGSYLAQLVSPQLVTAGTGDLRLLDVQAVATHLAGDLPALLHVDARPGLAVVRTGRDNGRHDQRRKQHHRGSTTTRDAHRASHFSASTDASHLQPLPLGAQDVPRLAPRRYMAQLRWPR
jgi:hypothetical protein